MKKTGTSWLRKLLMAASASAVASLMVLGGGAVASAQIGPANIDFNRDGSITVHKHSDRALTANPATGAEQDLGANADPLEGVEFRLYKANVDLSNPAVWPTLEKQLTAPADVAAATPVGQTQATDNQGMTKFTGLKPGVYVVEEQQPTGDSIVAAVAAPFYVVIPMQLPNQNDWTYDVHVYPKNEVSTEFTKALDTDSVVNSFKAGDPVNWKVSYRTLTVAAAKNDALRDLVVTDTLDSRLEAVDPLVQDVTYDGAPLAAGDYEAVYSQPNGTVTVSLTTAGLQKVSANSGRVLAFTVLTTPKADVATGNGALQNQASVSAHVVDGAGAPVKEDAKQGADTVYYGDARLQKVDGANRNALSGAEFTLYATEADAQAGANPIGTYTSDKDGVVAMKMIRVANDGGDRDYWVKETKAPAGYVLDDAVRQLTFAAGEVAAGTFNATVENVKVDNPVRLPLTGATGALLFTLMGAGLLGFGAVMLARSRKARVTE